MTWPDQGLTCSNLVQGQWNVFNSTSSNMYPGLSFDYTYTTSSISVPIKVKWDFKKCRFCSHVHISGQTGCIEQDACNNIIFVSTCQCQEYVPQDNLEYLEYLYNKKGS